jgi:alkylhydroperoxidase family enzyme
MSEPESPRLSPVSPDHADEQTKKIFEKLARLAAPTNPVLGTLMLHPDLAEIYMPFSDYLKNHGVLSGRDRELVILRTAWNCGADYQWVAHVRHATMAGITYREIERVARGARDPEWDADDSAVLRAVDELFEDHRIRPDTWDRLRTRLDPASLVEFLMLVGNYQMIGLLTNSVGLAPDERTPDFPGNSFAFVAGRDRESGEEGL